MPAPEVDRVENEAVVVFVPGVGLGEESCRPTMRSLDRRCVIATIPGFGRPAPPGHDLSPPALAVQLVGDLTVHQLPSVVLVGHSASCQIVAEAAAAAPDRVVGLVLVGPTTDPRARTWWRMAGRWLATAVHERPSLVPSLVRQYARTGLVSMLRSIDTARRHDIEAPLSRIEMPLVVLRGRHDRIAVRPWTERVAQAGRGEARTLPAGAHMVVTTHGDLVAGAIRTVVPQRRTSS